METSDSEYFESADEEFDSDNEKPKYPLDQHSSSKSAEKLKIDEKVLTSKNLSRIEDKIEPRESISQDIEDSSVKEPSVTETLKIPLGPHSDSKIVEPLVGKLKIDEKVLTSENLSRIEDKIEPRESIPQDIKDNSVKEPSVTVTPKNPLGPRSDSKIVEPLVEKLKIDEKVLTIENKIEPKKSIPQNIKSSAKEPNVTQENVSVISSNIDEKVKNTKKMILNLDSESHDTSQISTTKPKSNITTLEPNSLSLKDNIVDTSFKPETEEENLWDDDELDWESEAAKEETENTKETSSNLKNEDTGGWDDFDDWAVESKESPKDNNQGSAKPIFQSHNTSQSSNQNPDKTHNTNKNSEPNLWEDDDWEPLEKPTEKPQEEQSSWGSWGNWGVSAIINTASQSVSTLTSHVSQGLSTVLETGIGLPTPEEMAKINRQKEENEESNQQTTELEEHLQSAPGSFGLGNFVSSVSHLTKFVETTGTKVIAGSLDTLEAIGKKTVEVLQEGDPGLKKKRAFLKLDNGKPNLSQILREAKEKAAEENRTLEQKSIEIKRLKNYETLFDDHQGLVHLEALEMLSKLCNMKLENINNSLTGDKLKDMQETLDQVKELCELPEDDEDDKVSLTEAEETINVAVTEMNISISYEKFFKTCRESEDWLINVNLGLLDEDELHQQAIETLAQLTAFAVEQFHKTGELLLVKDHRSTADEADSLVQITTNLKSIILVEAGKFTDKLSSMNNGNQDKINEHITNIFYEAANSGSYIQNAFQLLIPVLQVGAV